MNPSSNIQKTTASPPSNPNKFPDSFYCPISLEVMTDPVIASDSYTYDRSSLTEYIRYEQQQRSDVRSPMTREILQLNQMVPNRALRDTIESALALQASNSPSGSSPQPPVEDTYIQPQKQSPCLSTHGIKLSPSSKAPSAPTLPLAPAPAQLSTSLASVQAALERLKAAALAIQASNLPSGSSPQPQKQSPCLSTHGIKLSPSSKAPSAPILLLPPASLYQGITLQPSSKSLVPSAPPYPIASIDTGSSGSSSQRISMPPPPPPYDQPSHGAPSQQAALTHSNQFNIEIQPDGVAQAQRYHSKWRQLLTSRKFCCLSILTVFIGAIIGGTAYAIARNVSSSNSV